MNSIQKRIPKLSGMLLLGFIGAVVLLSIVQLTMFLLSRANTETQANRIIKFSTDIAGEIQTVATNVVNDNINNCQPDSINKLRTIIWDTSYINDIGIIQDNAIICSGAWGILPTPINIPNTTVYYKDGLKKITDYNFPLIENHKVNILLKNNVAIIPTQIPMNILDNVLEQSDVKVTTLDETQVLYHNSFNAPPPILPFQTINYVRCDSEKNLCIRITHYGAGISNLSATVIIFIAALGFIFGLMIALLAYFISGWRNTISNRLKRAIKNKALYVEYQPIVELKSRAIVGAEALVRWKDDMHGQVSAELFIQLAEKLGITHEITKLVIDKSLEECQSILTHNQDFFISFNLSSGDLCSKTFFTQIQENIKTYRIHAHQIAFEITEHINLDAELLSSQIKKLMSMGHSISLDDFGTGSSNLSSLVALEFDTVKIDKMFLHHLNNDKLWMDIIYSIIRMVESHHKRIVFEGIEEQYQSDFILKNTQNAYGQGWLFYKAMRSEQLMTIIAENNPPRHHEIPFIGDHI
ncbi:EAL domain-containing protein [Musicola keenii]|uniref:EAL domain-containing protein n=1 Tax=Musicola keenii TaxID=2884250 RepID=UPI001782AA2E|nr:EAL domain-containing protein [Musicola keenii]